MVDRGALHRTALHAGAVTGQGALSVDQRGAAAHARGNTSRRGQVQQTAATPPLSPLEIRLGKRLSRAPLAALVCCEQTIMQLSLGASKSANKNPRSSRAVTGIQKIRLRGIDFEFGLYKSFEFHENYRWNSINFAQKPSK